MADTRKIPDWVLKMTNLRRDVVAWPLDAFRIGRNGRHGAWRTKPSEGWCPPRTVRAKDADPKTEEAIRATDYPCKHYGADLQAPKGSKVYAPHDGWILYAGPAAAAPFSGYGPGAILIAHHDTQDSVWSRGWKYATGPLVDIFDFPDGQVASRYSLLGHVVPVDENFLELTGAARIPLPEDVWSTSKTKLNRDHWFRLKDGTVGMMSGADAVKQSAAGIVKRWVNAGDHIAYVSDANHVHWEIRTAPLAGRSGRIDPIATWQQHYGKELPTGSALDEPTPVPVQASGGGGAALALLALLALGGKRKGKRKRRR